VFLVFIVFIHKQKKKQTREGNRGKGAKPGGTDVKNVSPPEIVMAF